MSHTFYTDGIVLHKRDYTEYSQMYSIYTRDYGKISGHCRGSKKLKSKLSPHMEAFCHVKLHLVQGKRNNQIIGVVRLHTFDNILADYQKILYGSYCLELIERVVNRQDRDEEIFSLLHNTLDLLDKNSDRYDLILAKKELHLSYSLINVYLFHAITSVVVYIVIEIIAEYVQGQEGYGFLASVFLKIGFFLLLFKSIIFPEVPLEMYQRVSMIVPFFLFLSIEAIGVVNLLKLKDVN